MTVHEGVSSQAGLASFRPWMPDHSTYREDALIREARASDVVDPDPWTADFKARNWAYRTEETD